MFLATWLLHSVLGWLLSRPLGSVPDGLISVRFFLPNATQPDTFPESPHLAHKPSFGICFSGGGSRSYEASLGYLRALHDAGILAKVQYISSVSGGSWANAVFSYHDRDKLGIDELLGDYAQPQDLHLTMLAKMRPRKSARYYPVKRNLLVQIFTEMAIRRANLEDVWVKAVHKTFLEPAGISLRALPALSLGEIAVLVARNPGLINQLEFRSVAGKAGELPFPILNTAMLGPIEAAPFGVFTRKYTMMETSPLYIGFPIVQRVTYPTPEGKVATLNLGGMVEPAGFGSPLERGSVCGLGDCPERTTQRIPLPVRPFSIANATAASSWALGGMIAEQSLLKDFNNVLVTAPYFSPYFGGNRSVDVFLGDGENIENQGVITLLRRGVKTICMFINSPIPLSDKKEYHPHTRGPKPTDVDSSFMNLFGYRTLIPPLGEDYTHVQVFRKRDFAKVMSAMQDSYERGAGVVVEMDLEVVENKWWGIKGGGRKVHMVFVYMARCLRWELALPVKTAGLVAPHRDNSTRAKSLPTKGPFAGFPHIPTSTLHLTAPVANALADMSAWVIKENINLFTGVLERALADQRATAAQREPT